MKSPIDVPGGRAASRVRGDAGLPADVLLRTSQQAKLPASPPTRPIMRRHPMILAIGPLIAFSGCLHRQPPSPVAAPSVARESAALSSGASPMNSEGMRIAVIGNVAQAGEFPFKAGEASLALALEKAGGISRHGSLEISITTKTQGSSHTFRLPGSKFYEGDKDFLLPDGTMVMISQCDFFGTENTRTNFARLEESRREFLRRRAAGEINLVPLNAESLQSP